MPKTKFDYDFHGLSYTPEYYCWIHMKARCLNPNNTAYHNYGERGISICERWSSSFLNFLSDMGNMPSRKHTIDRIDNNGDYTPDNCRWVTRKYQQRNRRNTVYVTFNGETKSAAEWSEITGIKRHTIVTRIKRGWTPEDAITRKP
jgi:hypothetical protein